MYLHQIHSNISLFFFFFSIPAFPLSYSFSNTPQSAYHPIPLFISFISEIQHPIRGESRVCDSVTWHIEGRNWDFFLAKLKYFKKYKK